jgi:tetratricopeptide (TPR) repeat protein
VAINLNGLGIIAFKVGEREEALRLYRRALEILERSMGPESALAATLQGNVGMMLDQLGRDDEAVVYYERSLAAQRKVMGPDDPRLSSILANLGAFWMRRKRPEMGLPYLEESVAVMEKRSPTNPELGPLLENVGVAYLEQGQPERALPVLERAAALIAKEHEPDFPDLAALRASLARGLAAMGRRGEAIAMAEQSIRLLDAKEPKRTRRATAREILAKILWETPSGRARARKVADEALAIYFADGEPSAEDAETLRTWLKGKR